MKYLNFKEVLEVREELRLSIEKFTPKQREDLGELLRGIEEEFLI